MPDHKIEDKIKSILAEAEPYITGHGGHIDFVTWESETGRVYVNLQGACEHCSLSALTLKFGLEQALKKELPEVREVVPV